jgi:hypothetical protein
MAGMDMPRITRTGVAQVPGTTDTTRRFTCVTTPGWPHPDRLQP